MGLADEIEAERSDVRRWTRDLVDRALGPEDAKVFAEYLADSSVNPMTLLRVLRARGINITHGSVYRWANEARDRG